MCLQPHQAPAGCMAGCHILYSSRHKYGTVAVLVRYVRLTQWASVGRLRAQNCLRYTYTPPESRSRLDRHPQTHFELFTLTVRVAHRHSLCRVSVCRVGVVQHMVVLSAPYSSQHEEDHPGHRLRHMQCGRGRPHSTERPQQSARCPPPTHTRASLLARLHRRDTAARLPAPPQPSSSRATACVVPRGATVRVLPSAMAGRVSCTRTY